MDFLQGFMSPIIVGICLVIGFVIKMWIKDVDNKYIPTICAVVGVLVATWIEGFVLTPETLLTGLFSGLASTGMHQMFKQYIDKGE